MTIQELTTLKTTLNRCLDEAYKNKSLFLADELLKCRDWTDRDLRLKTINPVTGNPGDRGSYPLGRKDDGF